jgi:hypothetical protein
MLVEEWPGSERTSEERALLFIKFTKLPPALSSAGQRPAPLSACRAGGNINAAKLCFAGKITIKYEENEKT